MIHILTDSTADLTGEQCKDLNIETIPMYVQVNGKMYKDGEDIEAHALFNTVERTGKYPTTSAPSPNDFLKFFNRKGKSLYLGVSSMLSATIRNAKLALSELGDRTVEIIDSLSISSGYGQIVLKAAAWRNEGMDFEELIQRVQSLVRRSRGIVILDNLDYLYHGGRCSAIENFVSSLLRIRPFLNLRPDGTLGVLQKVRGSRTKAVQVLLEFIKAQFISHDICSVTLTHLDCDDEVAYLTDEIKALRLPVEISTAKVGCVLATHSGPKPLGIAYCVD